MKHDTFIARFMQKVGGMSFQERLDLAAIITESLNFAYLGFLQKQKKGNISLIMDAAFYLNFPPQTRYEWEQVDSISCHLAETGTKLLEKKDAGWAATACIVAFEMLAFLRDRTVRHFETIACCILDNISFEIEEKDPAGAKSLEQYNGLMQIKAILLGSDEQNEIQAYFHPN